MNYKTLWEVIGRFGLLLALAVVTNRSQWYATLTPTTFNEYVLLYVLGITTASIWCVSPLFIALYKQEKSK